MEDRTGEPRRPAWPASGLALAGAAWAWWASTLRPFTTGALVATLAAGAAAAAFGAAFGRRPARPAATPARGAAVWMVLLAALAAWELASWAQHPRGAHPTLSSLAEGPLRSRPVRAGALLAWLAGAAALARR